MRERWMLAFATNALPGGGRWSRSLLQSASGLSLVRHATTRTLPLGHSAPSPSFGGLVGGGLVGGGFVGRGFVGGPLDGGTGGRGPPPGGGAGGAAPVMFTLSHPRTDGHRTRRALIFEVVLT